MNVVFFADAWDEFTKAADNPADLRNVLTAIEDARTNPYSGPGRPHALKKPLDGWWSRDVAGNDRLVYRVRGNPGDLEIRHSLYDYHHKPKR